MERAILAALVGALTGSACQSTAPCNNDELRVGVAHLEQSRAAAPFRVGEVEHGDIVARIYAACPQLPLPRSYLGGAAFDPDDPARARPAILATCPSMSTTAAARARVPADQRGDVFYDGCELARFGLMNRGRFSASSDGFHAIVAYDHMLRQSADPQLAGALVDELLFQTPWTPTEQSFARLPTVAGRRPLGRAVGIAVSRTGIRLGDTELALDAAPDAFAELQSARARWPTSLPNAVLFVDDDVSIAALATVTDAAIAAGITELFAFSAGSAIPLVGTAMPEHGVDYQVCIDATSSWGVPAIQIDTSVRVAQSPAQWTRFVEDGETMFAPYEQNTVRVTVAANTSITRLLTALAADDHIRADRGQVSAVVRIEVLPALPDCVAWFAQIEAARTAAHG